MNKKQWTIVFLVELIVNAPSIIIPILTGMVSDRFITAENQSVRLLMAIMLGLLAAALTSAISIKLTRMVMGKLRTNFYLKNQIQQYKKMQRLPIDAFDKNNSGFFYTRLTEDSETSALYKTEIPVSVLSIAIGLIATLITFIIVNWKLGVVGVSVTLMAAIFLIIFRKTFKKGFMNVKKQTDRYNTFLSNSINGVREIKNFNAQDLEMEKYKVVSNDYRLSWENIHRKAAVTMSTYIGTQFIISSTIAILGAYMLNSGEVTLGTITILISLSTKIMRPLGMLLAQLGAINRGRVSNDRLVETLKLDEELYEGDSLEITEGKIEFVNATLSYNDKITAFKNLNLTIKPGENVAIVGKTGSGKSTLLKALVKHYPLTGGKILIDGKDITNVGVNSLRSKLTYISQENYLTNSTIKENIVFANENVDIENYNRAIDWSESRFIRKLPENDQTNVGPDGVKLSGGQKQRITIARGLFKESKIVLLDEATSALDNVTETNIQENINDWSKDKTTITIAHRLSTIRNADRILYMEDGSIVEQGTHDELVERRGKYFQLLRD